MKKIYRLLMSVVAVAGTLACTTDATEDFGVKVGGRTQLTLSLDGSRTQLGEKADGVYPLTWSEGDQISVNGVVSEGLTTTEGAGTANAVFTFGGELKTPYCIAYPAAAEGQVNLAAVQQHNSDTSFANNAAAMYGYSANGENITLKHLTGVLKFSIKATDEILDLDEMPKLKRVTVANIDRSPIAGPFNIDFTTGELTPTEEATSVISYVLDDYRLPPSASIDLYVTVPAGTYEELYVTIEDANGVVRYATIKADSSSPLVAGKVREFSNPIVLEPMDTESVFIIKDYDSLVAFGEYAATGTSAAPVTKDAVFVADVDLTDKSWTSIEARYYTGTINGNGHIINGLTKRLFTTLGATVKGLHLTNVNYSSNNGATGNLGPLAGVYYGPCITHCSTSGTVTLTKFNGDYAVRMGGIIATISSTTDVEISHCVNRCNLVVQTTTSGGAGSWPSVGGIYGIPNGATGTLTLKNCVNEGNITTSGGGYFPSRTAGIAAYVYEFKSVNIENCVNKGAVTFSVAAVQNSSRNTYVGGIVANIETDDNTYTIKNCRNEGPVTVNSSNMNRNLMAGGVIGYALCKTAAGLVVENCSNKVAVTVDIDACKPTNADAYTNFASAIIGRLNSTVATKVTLKDLSNSGKLTYAGCNVLTNSESNSGTKCEANTHTYVNVGGIAGNIVASSGITPTYTFTNWTNTGDVEVTIGKEGLNGENSYFGGFIGKADNIPVTNVEFKGTMTVSKDNGDNTYSTYSNAGIFAGNASGTFTGTISGAFVCGDGTTTLSSTTLSADNYFKYLFSDRTLSSYDGVSLLTSKPL